MPHPIDYAVYQHLYQQSDAFMTHLKTVECQMLVKPYCLYFEHAAKLIETIIATRTLTLTKQENMYQCTIDDASIGQSLYPSMAVCLAILDSYGEKEVYEEEAVTLVATHIADVKTRSAELERRLKQDAWKDTN